MLKNCYECCRYNIVVRMRLNGKCSMRQLMSSAVFATRLHSRSCISFHNISIQHLCCFVWEGILLFTLLYLCYLIICLPGPFKKVCFKEYIHHCICKSQYEGKWRIGIRKTIFTDLLKCTEQNRVLIKYHRHIVYCCIV